MPRKRKITFKLLGSDDVWHPKVGPPFGSRNAWKTGVHCTEVRALRTAIRDFHRRAKTVIADADAQIANRMPQNKTGPRRGATPSDPVE